MNKCQVKDITKSPDSSLKLLYPPPTILQWHMATHLLQTFLLYYSKLLGRSYWHLSLCAQGIKNIVGALEYVFGMN